MRGLVGRMALGGALSLLGLGGLARAADVPRSDAPIAYIEAVEGEGVVVLTRPKEARNLEVHPGRSIEVGDVIKTGPATAVRLFYQSGARVFVGRATEFRVLADAPAVDALSLAPLPGGELERGQVRAQVDPAPPRPSTSGQAVRPHRFQVRTRAAVMGVRGTDFVVDSVREKAELHTFSGEVEVGAKGADGLGTVRRSVRAGQWVEADVTRGVAEVRSFDVKAYEAKLAANQPEWSALEKAVPGDAKRKQREEAASRSEPPSDEPSERQKPEEREYPGHLWRFAVVSGVGTLKQRRNDAPQFGLEWRPSYQLLWDHLGISPRLGVGWNTFKLSPQDSVQFVQIQAGAAAEVRLFAGLTGQLAYLFESWQTGPLPRKAEDCIALEFGWQFKKGAELLGVRRFAYRITSASHTLHAPPDDGDAHLGTSFQGFTLTFDL